jgi:EAL domain-containing protein (putative c-di-GMP-specific phosphodiesterase class I)
MEGSVQVSLADVRNALRAGEFEFYYQPKVAFLTGRVSGAEALIRWRRRGCGVVRPREFIPVAEEHDLISELTETMFPRLVQDFQRIRARFPDGVVAFNVSARDLDGPMLLRLVRDVIDRGLIDSQQLQIEITESAVVSGTEAISATLSGLVTAGVRLLMDDYGTGFSSLETLNRLPFSAIKLDQSFVLNMLESRKSATLVKASVAMAQMLEIKTIIEGIETAGVYEALMHSGCTEGQGYWISHPLPLDDYLGFLSAEPRWPASPVGLLRMAQLTHNWQHKLLVDVMLSYLRSEEPPDSALQGLHRDTAGCALGQWYYGPGQQFRGVPAFDALEAPHRSMHEICERMFAAVRDHAGAASLERLLQELSDESCQVFRCLQQLETGLLVGRL